MKTLRQIRWTALACMGMYVSLVVALSPAMLQSASAISRGYASDDPNLQPGMVAALSDKSTADSPKAKRASQEDGDRIIGVTTTPEKELLTIASGDQQQVYVQITGEVDAFVSDINGTVKNGDLLTISPILGVLMKADANPKLILGIALEDFDESAAETKSITDNDDAKLDIKVVKTRLNLDRKATANEGGISGDSSLQRLGQSVTGKHDVNEVQVIAALIIFLMVLVAEGTIMYGSVSSSIAALGRNPLARKIILKELSRVVMITFGVLAVGLLAVYGILWL
jgi:hypothetical protein